MSCAARAVHVDEVREHIIRIWLESFADDTRGEVEDFLNMVCRGTDEQAFVWDEEGVPVSVTFALPAECVLIGGERISLRYIYAAATARNHRGRGIFPQLLEYVHGYWAEHGVDAMFLRPAGTGLERYYERLGYRPCFCIEERFMTRWDFLESALPAPTGAAVEWPGYITEYAAHSAKQEGGGMVRAAGGHALCVPQGNELLVRDWRCTAEGCRELAAAVDGVFNAETLRVRMPAVVGQNARNYGWVHAFGGNAGRLFGADGDVLPYMGIVLD